MAYQKCTHCHCSIDRLLYYVEYNPNPYKDRTIHIGCIDEPHDICPKCHFRFTNMVRKFVNEKPLSRRTFDRLADHDYKY